jgi:hypothetical protein
MLAPEVAEQVAEKVRRVTETERELFHRWIVAACMQAYFAEG